MGRASTGSLTHDEIIARLENAASLVRAACETLDDVARLAPPTVTDRLNEVEGQADLGVTANNLSTLAGELERDAAIVRVRHVRDPPAEEMAKPMAVSKSRGSSDKVARNRGRP